MFDSTHTRTTLNDNASASSGANSFSGFSAYSAGTSHTFHTVAESTVAQIFGSTKVKFHGRQKELNILHGIYNEVCGRISGRSKDSNTNTKNDSHLQQEIQITDKFPDNHSTASASKSTISTTSTPANIRRVALVSGISGAGKSALVRHFIKELRTKKNKTSRTITNDKVDDGGCDGDNDGENGHESGNQNDTTEPIFLHGKFDELAGADPFSAIVEAFTGLAPLLLEGRTETDDEDDEDGMHNEFAQDLVRIQKDVRICLRPEDVSVLTAVVPALKKILSDVSSLRTSNNTGSSKQNDTSNLQESTPTMIRIEKTNEGSAQNANSWNRLKYVLQLFTRTIASRDRPVVILLDDLQRADSASLELIEALVTDKGIRNFMFIGTFRSDEIDHDHPLNQQLARISTTQPIESISIGNLTLEQLIEFLHFHMKIDSFDCKNLATKVHATTNGNLFYVIQILVELNRQCALIYSDFRKEWEWDDVAGMLVLESGISDNLEEAVEMKIRRSPKLLKKALITMAFTRGTINIETLHKLMERDDNSSRNSSRKSRKSHRRPIDMNQLRYTLDRAVLEGFLSNNIGSNYYSFAHDKVLEGSYALIKEGSQRERFRLTMGRRLYKIGSTTDAGETWMLFAAAEHLNSSLSLTDKDPLFVARMNLDIGERASKVSAYDQASKCLMAGLEALLLMPDLDPWEAEYDLTLRLHRTIADVELFRGNFESGNEIGRRLLEKARSLKDKLPTYESLALALGREELHAEALEMNREAMIQLGEYPKRMRLLVLVKELLTIRKYMKNTSDSDMMKLPKMTDNSKQAALTFARGLAIQGFYCDNTVEFLMGTVRALGITFKYGLSGYSSMSIIAYGLIQSTLNDHASALRGASLARCILRKCEARDQESVFHFCAAHFTESWVDPHEKSLEAYRQGHFAGMESGDIESAFLNSFAAVQLAQSCGSPLGRIGIITRELLLQMDLYNIKSVSCMMEQVYLPVQYVSGSIKCIEPPWHDLAVEPLGDRRTSSENLRLLHWYLARVELGVYFGNYEFADQMAEELRKVLPRHPAFVEKSFRLFYPSLAAAGIARQMQKVGKLSRARKYKKKAKRLAIKLGHVNKSLGPNSYHRELILLAELNLVDKEQNKVSYDTAIEACLKIGHIHDAALGSELAGEYYFANAKNNHKEGTISHTTNQKLIRRHFTRARDLYSLWGAHAKVEQLQRERGDYIQGRKAYENGGIVAIDLDSDVSRASSDIDYSSTHSSEFSKASGPPVLYNPRLLDLLEGIVPSSGTTGADKPFGDKNIEGDDLSMMSDIDTDTF